jgi:hypothetical protein
VNVTVIIITIIDVIVITVVMVIAKIVMTDGEDQDPQLV